MLKFRKALVLFAFATLVASAVVIGSHYSLSAFAGPLDNPSIVGLPGPGAFGLPPQEPCADFRCCVENHQRDDQVCEGAEGRTQEVCREFIDERLRECSEPFD